MSSPLELELCLGDANVGAPASSLPELLPQEMEEPLELSAHAAGGGLAGGGLARSPDGLPLLSPAGGGGAMGMASLASSADELRPELCCSILTPEGLTIAGLRGVGGGSVATSVSSGGRTAELHTSTSSVGV